MRGRARFVSAVACLFGVATWGAGRAQAQAAQRAPDRFMIAAIDVSGATKLSQVEIERLVYPHLGPDRSNDDVIAAQKALQDAYAAKGYGAVLVDVPIQPEETFREGIVQIAVNETPLGRVRVVGAKYHSLAVARTQVPSLVEGQPVDLTALQRDVTAANRFPDRTIDPTFRPGQVPGTIDVDLKVDDERPYHASVELNNDNSPSTLPLRLSASARYSDLWGLGHTFSETFLVAPQDSSQSAVFSASYTAPLIGTPWSVLVYGYASNSNVAALGGTNVLGDGAQIGLRAIYRLPSTELFQQVSFGPDFKAFRERIFLNGAPIQPSPVHYIPFVADYTLAGSTETTSFGVTAGITAGLRVVKRARCEVLTSEEDERNPNRCEAPGAPPNLQTQIVDQFGRSIDARENFVHFNLDANYTATLPGASVMALRFAGQLSDSPLVTNEQFGVGGMTNVRGYYLSEAIGDNGFNESLELRSPDVASFSGKWIDELRVFSFGDVGYASLRRVSTGQRRLFKLASVGAGLRFRALDYLSGEFVIGVPIVDGPITDRGDPRYTFSIKGEF